MDSALRSFASGRNHDDYNGNNREAPSAITPAMSLFEKYSMLDRGIDEAREESKRAQVKIDEIQQNISQTRQERDTMKRDIIVAKKEANEYNASIDQSNEELFEMEGERGRVMMEKQKARQELDQAKAFVDEQRRQFLDQSRAFRASCKRGRLRSLSLGLEYVPLKAYATVMVEESKQKSSENKRPRRSVVVPPSDFAEAKQSSILFPATTEEGEVADPSSDPLSWILDSRDDEMKAAFQAYRKEMESHEKTKQSLKELQLKEQVANEKAKKRSESKQQLQAQLNSLTKDCEGIEQEIAELQIKIVDTKELGRSYEKDIKAKRQAIAQQRFEAGISGNNNNSRNPRQGKGAAGRHVNPYAKRNSLSGATGGQNPMGGGGSQAGSRNHSVLQQPTGAPPPRSSSLTQFPHRSRRIRMGKQFASKVSISDLPPPPPPPPSTATTNVSRPFILDDSDDSGDEFLSSVTLGRKST